MAWLAALYGAYTTAQAANKPQNQSGSSTTTVEPWGPTADMRAAGLTRLWELNQGGYNDPTTLANGFQVPGSRNSTMGGYVGASGANQVTGAGRGGPGPAPGTGPGGGGGGGGGGYDPNPGLPGNPGAGQLNRAMGGGGAERNRGGAAPGGGQGGGGWNGQSDSTAGLIQMLTDRAQAGNQLYQPAYDATQNVLQGGDANPYRGQTFDLYSQMAQNGADVDPYLSRFINEQFGSGGGGAGGHGGGGGGGGFSFTSGGGGGGGGDTVGVSRDIRAVLDGKFLGKDNPYLQPMIDRANRGTRESFMKEKIPGINDTFQGSGMFGSSAWQNSMGQAGAGLAQALADQEAGLRYEDYNRGMAQYDNALGLGTQYDMNAADNATQRASAASAAGSAAYGSQLAADTARRGQLLDAIGMGTGMRQAGMGGMGGLSQDYGNDWRAALGMVPELSGMDVRDLQAAGGLSLGSDNARNDFIGSQNSLRAAQMGAGNQRAQLQWDKYKYNREAPMSDLAAYADIINRLGGGFGQTFVSDTSSRG